MQETAILTQILNDIDILGNEEFKERTLYFFKEPILCHGIKNIDLKNLGKRHLPTLKKLEKEQIINICSTLWATKSLEESILACQIIYANRQKLKESDFMAITNWINNDLTNWASCDTLCNHTVAYIITNYPELQPKLLEWCESPNRWVRRAAAVSLIVPTKRGDLIDLALNIASTLLLDKDDMVQKGYGWLLKSCSITQPQRIMDFVMTHKNNMPRTALRYSIEKLPLDWRKQAMMK